MKRLSRILGWRGPLIVLLTILPHLPALRGGFIWDDDQLITENRMLRADDALYRFWFTSESQDYRPMTWSLWWLEWHLWDGKAIDYRLVNLMLHAVNVVLVWTILQRLKVPGAWLAALAFGIHPVNVSTVAWISEQKNTLSMLLYATAILLYLRFDKEGGWPWYALSLAAGLFALLTKTAVVMLPVVLLGCVWWLHHQIRRRDFLRCLPYFVPALILGLVTVVQHHRALGETVVRTGGFASRLAIAGWIPWFYLYKALLPIDLNVIYPKWEIDSSEWTLFTPGITLIACFCLFWMKRHAWGRPLMFGLGYFVVMLFPVLGFFDQAFYQFSLVADHWQYYSIVGVIALVIAGAENVYRRMPARYRHWGRVIGAAVLMLLAGGTWTRSRIYASEEALWRDTVAKNPQAWVAYNNLGFALLNLGRPQDAIGCYEQALRLKPDFAGAQYNLANALSQLDRKREAVEQYEQALRLRPEYPEAHYNLAILFQQMGKAEDAIAHYEQALRFKPDYPEAANNLGNTLSRAGRKQQAIEYYEQALRFRPDYAEARDNLGNTLFQVGRVSDAIEQYEQALRLKPDFAEAHYNLGVALTQAGKVPEAIKHYEQALRIDPNLIQARNKLAQLRDIP